MAARKQDINDFRARLKNIDNPRNKGYFDPNLGIEVPKKVQRPKAPRPNIEDSILSVLIVSTFLGVVSMVFAEAVRVRYFEMTNSTAGAVFVDVMIGLWAVLIVSLWLDKRWISERFAQAFGIGAMAVGSHNLIWRWPDAMAYIYTDAHVADVTQNTIKYSLEFGSTVFSF
ncbi:hypothetical protein [Yoonia sp.]|uniref:hypothetical protein n=1 Tax=Yoonia sp. TaxID=2212373 RepID=UPI0023B6EFF0